MSPLVSLWLFASFLSLASSLHHNCDQDNDRPVIGILAQDYFGHFKGYGKGYSYIAASYVKFLESAGARVVPIMIDKADDYYDKLISNLNGVLFPGGGQDLITSGYANAGRRLFNRAKIINREGDYFPIWGTCLGYELMAVFAANDTNWLTPCDAHDLDLNLTFLEEAKDSRLFGNMSQYISDILKNQKVTYNYHKKCLTRDNFTTAGLNEFFSVITVNTDRHGLEFISAMEAKEYPFYGVQWHPEKNPFEFILSKGHENIPHSYDAIQTSQYFADFFVAEARKSKHFFAIKEESESLIYNYNPEYTPHSMFQQTYFFKSSSSSRVPCLLLFAMTTVLSMLVKL